jgi:hypothetical protein
MTPTNHLPRTRTKWLAEIFVAYCDAAGTIPFGSLVGATLRDSALFHLAPLEALKFRGLPRSARTLKTATDAALSSYVANETTHRRTLRDPRLAFAFCYLASHYGLGLITEDRVEGLMAYIELNRNLLNRLVGATKPNKRLHPTALGAIVKRRG